MSVDSKLLSANDRAVLAAVIKIFVNKTLQEQEQKEDDNAWITTRDRAELCDITIYRARHSLIRLEEFGAVTHRPMQKKSALNWKPTGKMT